MPLPLLLSLPQPLPPRLLPRLSGFLQRRRKALRARVKARKRISLQRQAFAALSAGERRCCTTTACIRARVVLRDAAVMWFYIFRCMPVWPSSCVRVYLSTLYTRISFSFCVHSPLYHSSNSGMLYAVFLCTIIWILLVVCAYTFYFVCVFFWVYARIFYSSSCVRVRLSLYACVSFYFVLLFAFCISAILLAWA